MIYWMRTRRTLCLLSPILLLGIALFACSSSAAIQQAPSPRSACSLLTTQEASAAFGAPAQPPSQCRVVPGDESEGLYLPGGRTRGLLSVNVSWNKEAVHTFRVSHSYHVHYGGTAPPPVYSRVMVSGIPAYWQPSRPTSGLGANVQILSTLKNGYVVTLISMSISESQDEQALASIVNRL